MSLSTPKGLDRYSGYLEGMCWYSCMDFNPLASWAKNSWVEAMGGPMRAPSMSGVVRVAPSFANSGRSAPGEVITLGSSNSGATWRLKHGAGCKYRRAREGVSPPESRG